MSVKSLANQAAICKGARCDNQVGEHARLESRFGSGLSFDFGQHFYETVMDAGYFLHRGLVLRSDKSIA